MSKTATISHYDLDGLVALIDMNEMQADRKVSSVMKVDPVADKWRAFGWHAQMVNGNSVEELLIGVALLGVAGRRREKMGTEKDVSRDHHHSTLFKESHCVC